MDISIGLLTALMFGSFFLLLALGVPLAWTMLSLAMIFGFILEGPIVIDYILMRTWHLMHVFALIAIPLFLFMANMLRTSGIADDLFEAVYIWLGPLRGGLAIATVVVCAVLAAMVGTVGAGVTIMGLISLPAMLQRKYNKHLALGSVLGGGSLGIMIPPSVSFILIGVFAALSIGKLFIGGIGPGLTLVALYVIYIGIRSYLNPTLAPAIPKEERTVSLRQKIWMVRTVILPAVLIMAVMGSIYLGLATPSEAAGVGAMGAMLCAAVRGKLNWLTLRTALFTTLKICGIIMWIAFSAIAFIGIFAQAGGAEFVGGMLAGLPLGRWGILVVIMLILLLLGMVLDTTGIIILCIPIFFPVIKALGFDPLWFAILFNLTLQIGFLTPPFGFALFYLKAVAPPDTTTLDLYRAAWPFIILQIIGLAIIIIFPQIAVWLPNQMIK